MKEQVGEKRSTVGIQRNADCLLKNTSIEQKKSVLNQNLEHLDDISFCNFTLASSDAGWYRLWECLFDYSIWSFDLL